MPTSIQLTDLIKSADSGNTDVGVRQIWEKLLPELARGASLELRDGLADPARFAEIYEVRARHLGNIGWDFGGFDETIRGLRAKAEPARVVSVDAERYHALCFLSPDLTAMRGFLYVKKGDKLPGSARESL